MKEYTIDDFILKDVMFEDSGEWRNKPTNQYFVGVHENGKFIINYSSILTFLIQKAGTVCKRYASDLFITWSGLNERLENYEYNGEKLLFGFRENGVDSNTFVLSRLNNYGKEQMDKDVKELYLLEVEVYPNFNDRAKYIIMKFGEAALKEDVL